MDNFGVNWGWDSCLSYQDYEVFDDDVGDFDYVGDHDYVYNVGDFGYVYDVGDFGYAYEDDVEDFDYVYEDCVGEFDHVYEPDDDAGDFDHVYEEEKTIGSLDPEEKEDDVDYYEEEISVWLKALSLTNKADEKVDDYEQVEKPEKWIEHYSSSQRILLVGEGNYSFSISLAKSFGSAHNIVATSLDSLWDLGNKYSDAVGNVSQLQNMGGLVLSGLDATQMKDHHFLTFQRFDRIVYNFPHVGFRFPEADARQIKMNKELVKGFLRNAKALLEKDIGEIHVTHKNGYPYYKWDLVKQAQETGLVLHETMPFYRHKYPGYSNKRADGRFSNLPFPLGDCTTYKFRLPQTPS